MSRPLPPEPNVTPSDSELELLSAYLDNALPQVERAALEQRLSAEPGLRRELEALQGTLAVLKNAPTLAPPRNFTLDPAQYRRQTPANRRILWLPVSVIGAAAALLLVALIASQTLSNVAAPAVYRSVSAPNAPGQIAALPTATKVALQLSSPSAASSAAAKTSGATASIASIAETATQPAADAAIQLAATPSQPPALAQPIRPTSIAPQVTLAPEIPTFPPSPTPKTLAAAANSGAVPSQNGVASGSSNFAGPSLAVPGTAPLPPATQAAQLAPALSAPSLPDESTVLAILIRLLLMLLGLKG